MAYGTQKNNPNLCEVLIQSLKKWGNCQKYSYREPNLCPLM